MRQFLVIFCLVLSQVLLAQSPVGIWKSIDDESGKEKSHVEIIEVKGKLYGKVIKLLDPNGRTTCTSCPGKDKGKPIIGMQVMQNMVKVGDEWTDGTIIDPANGKEYSCTLWFEDGKPNMLKLRGYIGFSLFGRTQTWHRVK
ncbi:MAG: DUF2147 domain-containing protein [Saprospiraceae bacterium]